MKNVLDLKTLVGLAVLASAITFSSPVIADGFGGGYGGGGHIGGGHGGFGHGGFGHGYGGIGIGIGLGHGGYGYGGFPPAYYSNYAPAYTRYRTAYVAPRRVIRRRVYSPCGR